jgi:hypothetical protein
MTTGKCTLIFKKNALNYRLIAGKINEFLAKACVIRDIISQEYFSIGAET